MRCGRDRHLGEDAEAIYRRRRRDDGNPPELADPELMGVSRDDCFSAGDDGGREHDVVIGIGEDRETRNDLELAGCGSIDQSPWHPAPDKA